MSSMSALVLVQTRLAELDLFWTQRSHTGLAGVSALLALQVWELIEQSGSPHIFPPSPFPVCVQEVTTQSVRWMRTLTKLGEESRKGRKRRQSQKSSFVSRSCSVLKPNRDLVHRISNGQPLNSNQRLASSLKTLSHLLTRRHFSSVSLSFRAEGWKEW